MDYNTWLLTQLRKRHPTVAFTIYTNLLYTGNIVIPIDWPRIIHRASQRPYPTKIDREMDELMGMLLHVEKEAGLVPTYEK